MRLIPFQRFFRFFLRILFEKLSSIPSRTPPGPLPGGRGEAFRGSGRGHDTENRGPPISDFFHGVKFYKIFLRRHRLTTTVEKMGPVPFTWCEKLVIWRSIIRVRNETWTSVFFTPRGPRERGGFSFLEFCKIKKLDLARK